MRNDKDAIVAAAAVFLGRLQDSIDPDHQRNQISTWLVRTGDDSFAEVREERRIPDLIGVTRNQNGLAQDSQFEEILIDAGIDATNVYARFVGPLVNEWASLDAKRTGSHAELKCLLERFGTAVIQRQSNTRFRAAIAGIELSTHHLELEPGIVLRPVTAEELWELGDHEHGLIRGGLSSGLVANAPDEEWVILSINQPLDLDDVAMSNGLADTVYTALSLVHPHPFSVLPIEDRSEFGFGAVVMSYSTTTRVPVISAFGPDRLRISEEDEDRLVSEWSRIRRILESDDHFLRLPAERLIDGLNRQRPEDAVIDVVIGLEAILLADSGSELSNQFGLRGATALGEFETLDDRRRWRQHLRDLYGVRSKIVHTGKASSAKKAMKVADARQIGIDALRLLWWWCLEKDQASAAVLHRMLDDRLLR